MDQNQVLAALIDHIDASDQPVSLGWDEVQQWGEGALECLVATGLLAKDVNARSLQCSGCDYHCFMDVLLVGDESKRAFIVCDHAEMQSQMGRINVPLERLQQWQTSTRQFAGVIAALLGLESKPVYQKSSASFKLGMLKSKNGRRWVLLNVRPLSLEINRYTIPLNDFLDFEDNNLVIDRLRIDELLSPSPVDVVKKYVPDVSKREAQKAATQLMYQDWQDAYDELKVIHSNQNIGWICRKIAKMSVGKNKDAEYIRRKIKP